MHDVVRDHVEHGASLIKITTAAVHAHGLRHGNLYVVNVTPVPDGLKDSVGKAECHDVLNGFFAQVMVDAVYLFLVRHLEQLLIENLGGFKIVTEGFFDDHPAPMVAGLFHQTIGSKFLNYLAKVTGSRCQVIENVLVSRMVAVDLCQAVLDLEKDLVIVEVAGQVVEAAGKTLPCSILDAKPPVLSDLFQKPLFKNLPP